MKPTGKGVMIIPDEPEQGEILTVKPPVVNTGTVSGIGKQVTRVQKQDHVVFNDKRTNIYKIDNQDIILINEEDIYAKIED